MATRRCVVYILLASIVLPESPCPSWRPEPGWVPSRSPSRGIPLPCWCCARGLASAFRWWGGETYGFRSHMGGVANVGAIGKMECAIWPKVMFYAAPRLDIIETVRTLVSLAI